MLTDADTQPFTKATLRRLLSNCTYRGRVRHRSETYAGGNNFPYYNKYDRDPQKLSKVGVGGRRQKLRSKKRAPCPIPGHDYRAWEANATGCGVVGRARPRRIIFRGFL
jgi:hypothetical protein